MPKDIKEFFFVKEEIKKCVQCLEEKPRNMFHRNENTKRCFECNKKIKSTYNYGSKFSDLSDEIIDEIGEYLGFDMWNKRDKTKEYDFPNARDEVGCLDGSAFMEGKIIEFKNNFLLVYKPANSYHAVRSNYTLNLSTLTPTKTSPLRKTLSEELIEKIKNTKK